MRVTNVTLDISSFIQSGQQIKISVKRASSIALTADGVTAHTGESYVAVTGHWIDRVPHMHCHENFGPPGPIFMKKSVPPD